MLSAPSIDLRNNVDTQLILEFKNSFGKYNPVFPRNPLKVFLGHAV